MIDSSGNADGTASGSDSGADGASDGTEASGSEVLMALRVDGAPEAVPRARREISSRLARATLPMRDLAGDIKLLAGELLTNAVLHGEPPVHLRLVARGSSLRVEVADTSQVAPLRARSSADTMTGRGLALVAAIAARWGTDVNRHGKVVWAEVDLAGAGEPDGRASPHPSGPVETGLEGAGLDGAAVPAVQPGPGGGRSADPAVATASADAASTGHGLGSPPRYRVSLGDVSTDLLLAAKSHVDNLVREFTLAAVGEINGESAPVPPELAELIRTVTERFGEARQAIRRQALAAAAAGQRRTQLELWLPASIADAGEEYLAALDKADGYAREARLLTLASPPAHRDFRRWYVSSLVTQLRAAGRGEPVPPPLSFEEYLRQRQERELPGAPAGEPG
ncbi:ATP-binding protein [Pseudofrankia sp. BMG5.36]|uniref:ATP-binding protein n=1 Tax=Pseudofrankia sp. BMG5.36 TaxID=1834512 RepID=UPI0008D8D651|nr:ATP-binding protein [Pseudofrankia sp. BMG5.36]OHV65194.1 ATP-binding protein [Pseudofrankia sp. BMG5.36]